MKTIKIPKREVVDIELPDVIESEEVIPENETEHMDDASVLSSDINDDDADNVEIEIFGES